MALVTMFVNGQAMSGGTLNDALHRARFIGKVDTAPRYRFYSVRDEFPGLHPVTDGGFVVPGELYEVEYDVLRDELLPREPEELELGVIELADGSGSLSMRMRENSLTAEGVTDISDRGGWLTYLAATR
nr:gamma-glutamylcyclotransferase [Rhodococcus sp. (in: high G+C Gram-positive bacteria)]